MAEAIRLTLHELLAADERIRVFGEDVADADDEVLDHVEGKGGVFGVTRGLQRRFGSARCYNTPLAESNIIGRGVGQALRGLRPCAEIQFFDYIWPAMQQLRSEAATIRWRSNGDFTCPLVVRVAIGGYLTGGAIWHSQSGESIFAHIPGLLVAFPSRARDAVGPAAQRLRGGGPGALPRAQAPLPPALRGGPHPETGMGRCPSDAAPWPDPGATSPSSRGAPPCRSRWWRPSELAAEGCSVEVVDLRTISPWDHDIVCESVQRTGRLARRPRGHPHRRVRRRGGGLGGRALLLGPRRARRPGGRQGHLRRLRALPRARHPPPGRRHRQPRPGPWPQV